ncbi:MAG: response regulator transcription factor [Acidobacteriaceae bacterium]
MHISGEVAVNRGPLRATATARSGEYETTIPELLRVIICDASRLQGELLAKGLQSLAPRTHCSYAEHTKAASNIIAEGGMASPVVLMANVTADGGPYRSAKRLHGLHPEAPIVLFADTCGRESVLQAFKAGAKGVVYRDECLSNLLQCILEVSRGKVWAEARELSFILEALADTVEVDVRDVKGHKLLTKREEEVVALVLQALSNREISSVLKISENTVKNYMFHIFEKLGISNRVELMRYAQRRTSADEGRLEAFVAGPARQLEAHWAGTSG